MEAVLEFAMDLWWQGWKEARLKEDSAIILVLEINIYIGMELAV